MRKYFIALFLVLLCANHARAQSTVTGRLSTAGTAPACLNTACVKADVGGIIGGATFSLTGTWAGTVTFYASADGGVTLVPILATPSNSSTAASTATANGVWQVNVSAYTSVYLIFTTATSGTVVATIQTSTASARGGSAAGGGGGGTIAGSISTDQVAFGSAANTIAGSNNFRYIASTVRFLQTNTCGLTQTGQHTICGPGTGTAYQSLYSSLAETILTIGDLSSYNLTLVNAGATGNTGSTIKTYMGCYTGDAANDDVAGCTFFDNNVSLAGWQFSGNPASDGLLIFSNNSRDIEIGASGTGLNVTQASFIHDGDIKLYAPAGFGTCFQGSTTGQACFRASATGTPNPSVWPNATATPGYLLSSNGANPQVLSWVPAIGGTISASHLVYASGSNTAADVSGSTVTGATGAISLVASGVTVKPLLITGASSSQTMHLIDVGTSGNSSAECTICGELAIFHGKGVFSGVPLVVIDQQDNATVALKLGNQAGANSSARVLELSTGVFEIDTTSDVFSHQSVFTLGDGLSTTNLFSFTSTAPGNSLVAPLAGGLNLGVGAMNAPLYSTATNCADSAGAAACGSAAAGTVVIDAAATTVVVSTTAVTANSEIFVQYDSSLGTRLSVTCNTTVAIPVVTARTAGTSFTITVPVAPITNPACYSYHIIN